MARIRDPEGIRSFNFAAPGEWVEVPDDNVEYLVSEYGVEVEGSPTTRDVVSVEVGGRVGLVPPKANAELDVLTETAIKLPGGRGWYEYQGRKVRKGDLPGDVEIVEE